MSGDGTPARVPVRSDDEIRNSVLMELKWDPKITSTDVGVAVKDEVVTLTWFVPSYWEKDVLEKAVKRVYGVRGIANDLPVKSPSGMKNAQSIFREFPTNSIEWSVMNRNTFSTFATERKPTGTQ